MIYYNPLSFYALIFAVRGSVLPSCALHAFIFAGVGAGAAYLVERDLLSHDFTSISLLTGLVMSLLLTFRLTFSFNRYAEAVATIAGLQGLCTQLVAKVCGSLDASDAQQVASVLRLRRWLSLACVLSKLRLRGEPGDLSLLEAAGLLSSDEHDLFRKPLLTQPARTAGRGCTTCSSSASTAGWPSMSRDSLDELGRCGGGQDGAQRAECFPSKARVRLVLHLMSAELSALLHSGALHTQQWASVDVDVSNLYAHLSRLDAMVAQNLPFAYANFIKFVLVLYIVSFPFSVAVELQWATPAIAYCAALIFLSIDRVAVVMEMLFADSAHFGLDLEKRIRRTDKETSAIVAAWRREIVTHLDLYPSAAKNALPRHLRRDAVLSTPTGLHGCIMRWCCDPTFSTLAKGRGASSSRIPLIRPSNDLIPE